MPAPSPASLDLLYRSAVLGWTVLVGSGQVRVVTEDGRLCLTHDEAKALIASLAPRYPDQDLTLVPVIRPAN